jgi:predicted kinase
MIVLMAGLPGSGKSTLARELAARTSGAVLNKDEIRSELFAPQDIEYSTEQDDFCQQLMLETAAYLLKKNSTRFVFLDGRPFSRRYQIDQVIKAAESLGQPCCILECVCSSENARRRIGEQALSAEHPARNRDFALYLRVKDGFEEIFLPKTVINTDQPLETCIELALRAVSAGVSSRAARTQSGQ